MNKFKEVKETLLPKWGFEPMSSSFQNQCCNSWSTMQSSTASWVQTCAKLNPSSARPWQTRH